MKANSKIINIGATEGDYDNVYMKVSYIDSNTKLTKEVELLYQKNHKGNWMYKNTIKTK